MAADAQCKTTATATATAKRASSVFVVIVTYNGEPWISKCLKSVLEGSGAPRIVVVDNASTDQTLAICQSTEGVEVIETGVNLGFGRANNIGLRHALQHGADYVLILNQDTHVAADMIGELVDVMTERPEVGICCPMQWDDTGERLDGTFLRYYLAPNAERLLSDAVAGKLLPMYDAAAAPAAAWLMSRKFLLEVGGFDPLFFMYGEDDDLCSRAAHHGFKLTIATQARFFHARGFHALVQTETVSRKLKRKTSRIRSSIVRDAKRPSGRFIVNLWQAEVAALADGVLQLLKHGDWIQAAAACAAAAVATSEVARIRRHRLQVLQAGAHWIDPNDGVANP